MGGGETIRNLDRYAHCIVQRNPAVHKALGQCLSFDVLHDEQRSTVVSRELKKCADSRMIQRGERAGFALEAAFRVVRSGKSAREYLDRNDPIDTRVACFVDLSHAAVADGGEDLVFVDARARAERRIRMSLAHGMPNC